MQTKSTQLYKALTVFTIVALALGCSDTSEVGDITISRDRETVTMPTQHGEYTMTYGASAKIPADFPKDIPTYPGATVTMSEFVAGKGYKIMAVTGDSMQKVDAYFKKEVAKNQWKETESMNQELLGTPTSITVYKKDGRRLVYTIMREDGDDQTLIDISGFASRR